MNQNIFSGFRNALKTDVLSGLLVSLIALPLCLGIASASGFPPLMGVITAIVGGIIVSLLAGSEPTIKGPAAGLIVILYGAVEELGKASGNTETAWKLTAALVLVAGLIQVALGFLKVAKVVELFPLSAVHGMLAAIGIIIMSKQIHYAAGIAPAELKGKEPLELLAMVPHSLTHFNWHIAIVGILSLIILFGWPAIKNKNLKKIPAALIVLLVGIILGQAEHLSGAEYKSLKPMVNPGELSFQFNADFSVFQSQYIGIVIKYLILFVLIGSLESLLSAKAIDLLDPLKRKSNFNKDLYAVGAGNALSGLLGGLPMISEIARSSANINNGGTTRWSNFFHGLFLLIFVLLLSPFIKMIPMASLAAMLIFVGYRLAAPKEFISTYRIGWEQLIIFVSTVLITLSTDLLVGVFSGILIKIVLQMIMGVPLKHYFMTNMIIQEKGDKQYHISLNSSGLFTNFLSVSGKLAALPVGSSIELDVSNARYIDHSFMEKLHEFTHDYHENGGHMKVCGTEKLTNISNHPLSARRQMR